MAITICELDITRIVLGKYKPQIISAIGACKIKVSLDTNDIIKVVDQDPLLQQEMVDAGQEAIEKAAKAIAAELKGYDADAEKSLKTTGLKTSTLAFVQGFEKYFGDATDDAQEKAKEGVQKVWKEYTKTHKEYRNYKIKLAGKVGLAVVGVGASIAGVAGSAGTAVPALVLGGIGIAKSTSTGLQALVMACKSSETVYIALHKDMTELKARYDDMSKMSATATEVFAKGLDKFTTFGMNSIRKCEADLNVLKSKLLGVKTHAHSVAVNLNKMLLNAGKIEDAVQDTGIQKLIAKVKTHLKLVDKNLGELIEQVETLGVQVKNGKQRCTDLAAGIQALKLKIDGRVYGGAAIAIDLAGLGADLWGGAFEAKEFSETPNILGNVTSSLSAVKEGFEEYFKNEK